MFTTASVKQLCTEYGSELLSIDSVKEKFSRETKVTVQCCVPDCTEEVSKSVRNLFKSKNFGCKIHFKIFKGQKISETKNQLNLRAATNNDSGKRYTHAELCAMECKPTLFDICNTLKITNYHNMNRNAIIDAIIERQNELDRLRGVEETKEPEDSVADEHTVAERYVDLMNESITQGQCIVNETKESESFEIVEQTVTAEIIDLTKDLKAQFLEKHFFFEYNGQVWTQANLVAEFLKYKDPGCAIRDLVDPDDKMHFKDFPPKVRLNISNSVENEVDLTPLVEVKNLEPVLKNRLQQTTLFITSTAILELFMRSKLPLARLMKKWLINEVIPSILLTGTYSLKHKDLEQSSIQGLVVAEPCPRITRCHNPNGFQISAMKSAIYILNLPFLNMFKFGYSNNLINRLKQHEYDFGEIGIEFVKEAPEVQEIEKRLKNEIRSHGINTVFEIDGRKLKELIEPEHVKLVTDIICDIITNYEIDQFTSSQNHEYRMVREQTKQKQCDIEILKLRIQLEKISRKRKLEMN